MVENPPYCLPHVAGTSQIAKLSVYAGAEFNNVSHHVKENFGHAETPGIITGPVRVH